VKLAGMVGVIALTLLAWPAASEPAPPAASAIALPDVMVGAVSISAVDAEQTANFYKAVFGMQEVRRIDARPQFLEIIMKPGSSAGEARKALLSAALIVVSRPAESSPGPADAPGWARVHAVLVVPFMAPVLERVRTHGGFVEVAPSVNTGSLESETDSEPGKTGSHVTAMIRDPGGNFVELLSRQ